MDLNTTVSELSSSLLDAVDECNVELARELLRLIDVHSRLGRNPNQIQHDRNFITVAVKNEDLQMVELLLEYGPNVNDADANDGELPLVEAARAGNSEIVDALLAYPGTKVNARDPNGYFALQAASEEGNYDIVEQLAAYEEHSKDEYSEALSSASYIDGDTDVMNTLLGYGADADYHGAPLYYALADRNWDAVRLLVSDGATWERAFKFAIRENRGPLNNALKWLSEDTTRTILCLKGLQRRRGRNWELTTRNWDAIVTTLRFHYFGPDRKGDPPCIGYSTAQLPAEEFKMAYKWMIHAVSTLLFLEEGNMLLPHLCRVFDPTVALELCEHTGKTPMLLALKRFPRRNKTKQKNAAKGTGLLIEWNPDALKIPDPKTQRTPLTCAIVQRVPLPVLQKMITCKNKTWFTAAPKQQDPVTLLPNFLLVAAGKNSYNVSDIYAFSRNFLPLLISSLMSPTGVPHQGIKRSREQI